MMIELPLVPFNPKDRTPNAPAYGLSKKGVPFFRCQCGQWFDLNSLTRRGFVHKESVDEVQHAGCSFRDRVRLLDFPEDSGDR